MRGIPYGVTLASIMTRPDTKNTPRTSAKFCKTTGKKRKAVVKILPYLRKTQDLGTHNSYGGRGHSGTELSAYAR